MLSYIVWGLVSLVAAGWVLTLAITIICEDKALNLLKVGPYVTSGSLLLWWATISLLRVLQIDLLWHVSFALLFLFTAHAFLLIIGVWRSVR